MQVRWEHLTPPEFERLACEEGLCVLPMGSLERHGEHMPFGTDAIIAHTMAVKGAEKEPCVVFPPYWFGQVHEAACFTGTVNFPQRLLLEMLEVLLDQIAQNGFSKILILNAHGGNNHFLQYFAMTQLDREVAYTLYIASPYGEASEALAPLWETKGGHADERETSILMAAVPSAVKMEYQRFDEPVLPARDLSHLGIHTGLWWYAKYPEHVTGCPSKATPQKGEKAIEAAVEDVAALYKRVKDDTMVPQLQQEFYDRLRNLRQKK